MLGMFKTGKIIPGHVIQVASTANLRPQPPVLNTSFPTGHFAGCAPGHISTPLALSNLVKYQRDWLRDTSLLTRNLHQRIISDISRMDSRYTGVGLLTRNGNGNFALSHLSGFKDVEPDVNSRDFPNLTSPIFDEKSNLTFVPLIGGDNNVSAILVLQSLNAEGVFTDNAFTKELQSSAGRAISRYEAYRSQSDYRTRLERSKHENKPYTVIFLNPAFFSVYNKISHGVGDMVLRKIGEVVARNSNSAVIGFRKADGSVNIAIETNYTEAEASQFVGTLIDAIRKEPFLFDIKMDEVEKEDVRMELEKYCKQNGKAPDKSGVYRDINLMHFMQNSRLTYKTLTGEEREVHSINVNAGVVPYPGDCGTKAFVKYLNFAMYQTNLLLDEGAKTFYVTDEYKAVRDSREQKPGRAKENRAEENLSAEEAQRKLNLVGKLQDCVDAGHEIELLKKIVEEILYRMGIKHADFSMEAQNGVVSARFGGLEVEVVNPEVIICRYPECIGSDSAALNKDSSAVVVPFFKEDGCAIKYVVLRGSEGWALKLHPEVLTGDLEIFGTAIEHLRLLSQLRKTKTTDALTGLRKGVELERETKERLRSGEWFIFYGEDLNKMSGLENTNGYAGRPMGDMILRAVGHTPLRSGELFRKGGEELYGLFSCSRADFVAAVSEHSGAQRQQLYYRVRRQDLSQKGQNYLDLYVELTGEKPDENGFYNVDLRKLPFWSRKQQERADSTRIGNGEVVGGVTRSAGYMLVRGSTSMDDGALDRAYECLLGRIDAVSGRAKEGNERGYPSYRNINVVLDGGSVEFDKFGSPKADPEPLEFAPTLPGDYLKLETEQKAFFPCREEVLLDRLIVEYYGKFSEIPAEKRNDKVWLLVQTVLSDLYRLNRQSASDVLGPSGFSQFETDILRIYMFMCGNIDYFGAEKDILAMLKAYVNKINGEKKKQEEADLRKAHGDHLVAALLDQANGLQKNEISLSPNQILCHQDEEVGPDSCLWILTGGEVSIIASDGSATMVKPSRGEPILFGELGIFSGKRTAALQVAGEGSAFEIRIGDFLCWAQSRPVVWENLVGLALARLQELQSEFARQGRRDLFGNLIRDVYRQYRLPIPLPKTRVEMANELRDKIGNGNHQDSEKGEKENVDFEKKIKVLGQFYHDQMARIELRERLGAPAKTDRGIMGVAEEIGRLREVCLRKAAELAVAQLSGQGYNMDPSRYLIAVVGSSARRGDSTALSDLDYIVFSDGRDLNGYCERLQSTLDKILGQVGINVEKNLQGVFCQAGEKVPTIQGVVGKMSTKQVDWSLYAEFGIKTVTDNSILLTDLMDVKNITQSTNPLLVQLMNAVAGHSFRDDGDYLGRIESQIRSSLADLASISKSRNVAADVKDYFLRPVHFLYWLAKAKYGVKGKDVFMVLDQLAKNNLGMAESVKKIKGAYNFFLKLRIAAQFNGGLDKINPENLRKIAGYFGYLDKEEFISEWHKQAENLRSEGINIAISLGVKIPA